MRSGLQPSTFNLQPSRRGGMALVISLIMLSVTLIMAVAFLAVARRERVAVSTASEATDSRLASDTALAVAEAQIAANLFANNNPYNFGLLVSTNYIDPAGYSPTNISNILPRPPVYVSVGSTGSNDFRFYLDLNRNGKFESNGVVSVLDNSGAVTGSAFEVGDPEWIGVLERPEAPHSANNKFISRYAYIAQPIGNTLDLNAIHNQSYSGSVADPADGNDGYFRNQGVGSWELNLAAFLADLNANVWDNAAVGGAYSYSRPGFANPARPAFFDAYTMLRYRYATNYSLLTPAKNYFNITPTNVYPTNLDSYTIGDAIGAVQNTVDYNAAFDTNKLAGPWAGGENTNRFFALVSDLFDPTKSSAAFTNRLLSAGTNVSTYDRYTYYRLLGQLGTESTVDDSRMNLNYDNLDAAGNVVVGAETNLIAWTPLRFFTNAANRLLTTYSANWMLADYNHYTNTFGPGVSNVISLTNIPVYMNGAMVYSPAINRLLQLAANIYDASTNSQYPSVFRPLFGVSSNNLYVVGYTNVVAVSGIYDPQLSTPVDAAAVVANGVTNASLNVYGVPWIIGAKKGFPNFNQFYQVTAVQVTRKLQVTKPSLQATMDLFHTNQMYVFTISNQVGCSFWNSYTSAYTGSLVTVMRDNLTMTLTNSLSPTNWPTFKNYSVLSNVTVAAVWPGTLWSGTNPTVVQFSPYNNSMVYTNATAKLLTNSIFRYGGYVGVGWPIGTQPGFDPYNTDFQTNVWTPQLPQMGLITTNRLQAFVLDGTNVIDYVHFSGPDSVIDLNTNLADPDYVEGGFNPAYLWSTNGGTTPWGVMNQIIVSQGAAAPPSGGKWEAPPNLPNYLPQTPLAEQVFFTGFFNVNRTQPGVYLYNERRYTNSTLACQAPYTPTRVVYNYTTWQANDPLVHYLAGDLGYSQPGVTGVNRSDDLQTVMANLNLNPTNVNKRYSPWGHTYPYANVQKSVDAAYLTAIKDPLVWRSDFWDFPTFKYPTVGWLGRVHRGTPWQTVYLKSTDILANPNTYGPSSWSQWTGNSNVFDATNAAPLQDELLFDLFSATLHPNATRGNLSVNTGVGSSDPAPALAAWSALFSGMVAMTNAAITNPFAAYAAPTLTNWVISPAGAAGSSAALWYMVTNLNAVRSNFTNTDGVAGVFEHVGNILRAPALTEQSPFLNVSDSFQQQQGISDQLYEWLPQQSLGLLRLSGLPRYVVYCYGQALRPAPNSFVTSGVGFGTCTNYQIVGESAVRAVIRINKQVTATATNYSVSVESLNVLPPN